MVVLKDYHIELDLHTLGSVLAKGKCCAAVVAVRDHTGNSVAVAVVEQRCLVKTLDPDGEAEPAAVAVRRAEDVGDMMVFEASGEFEPCYLGVSGALVHLKKL